MKKFFRTIYESFYSKELYHDAAYSWKGSGIGLMSGFAVVAALFIAALLATIPATNINNFKAELLSQAPHIKIENGELSIDRPTPYYMSFVNEPKTVLFDTSDAAAKLSLDTITQQMDKNNTQVFITKHQIIIKDAKGLEVHELSQIKETLYLGPKEMESFINFTKNIPAMAISTFLFVLLYKIFQLLIYSLFALGFNKKLGTGFKYSALQRITACAIFPATILNVGMSFIGLGMPFILSTGGTLIFIFFGIKSAKEYKS